MVIRKAGGRDILRPFEKDMGELNPMYKRENLRLLRRALRLTQKEFIDRFLSDEEGKPTMSIATLSNLEAKDGPRMNDVIISVSEQLGIDSASRRICREDTYSVTG